MYWGVEIELHAFLTSPLVGGLLYALGFMWTEGWEGFIAGLDAMEMINISCPCLELNPSSCHAD
jgi:hypothetical protein